MSKVETIEGVEGEAISTHKAAHPSESVIVAATIEGLQNAFGSTAVIHPKALGLGRGKNTVLVNPNGTEWVRVTIKVTGVDTSDES